MKNMVDLPENYKPFKTLVFCSNTLVNGKVPISISGDIPILIGQGSKLKIWINLLSQNKSGKTRPIVRESLSLHPQVQIDQTPERTKIFANKELLVEVIKKSSNEADVIHLDLRPIGISIFGDKDGLNVGNQTMSGNTFSNVDCMVGIDASH
ncbi:hypothetical protein [Reinekea blandensis]|uniref:Uncharacterized protein n=1 Tax=Reinekea blandensis MED297 TaxID=314283 RepID=A4BKM3_9GAMM|nr:hypothetical protein [Reinekea blandensis]EAR07334.1 hypothetical protein MED297_18076 [Reinekea sp. MED297] [Reinekea blandensis MED297]